jgi:tetratricopeptide (TPR) repeat protein
LEKWEKTTKKEFKVLSECSPDEIFPFLRPDQPPPEWLAPVQQRLVSFPLSTRLLDILRIFAQPTGIVKYSLLAYASVKRKCWAPSGNLEDFSIDEVGVDRLTIKLLCDKKKLNDELKILESKQLIHRNGDEIRMSQGFVVEWKKWKQAIPLICFYFTGCEYSDRFSPIGNSALPVFQEMIKQFTQQHEDERRPHMRVLLPALVQASKFSTLPWKRKCIDTGEQEGFQDSDDFTHSYLCLRKAFVLRSEGDWATSFQVVRKCLALLEVKNLDPRLNAVRGLLVNSLATSLWEREEFDEATSEWTKWQAGDSLFEIRASIKTLTSTGKSLLHQGNFVDAEKSLHSALRQYVDGSRLRLDVLATLSDVYCELRTPSLALSILQNNHILEESPNDRYYTNCYISYAQALVCMRKHKEAGSILVGLKEQFESNPHLDRHDQRRHIRVVLLLAQSLHLQAETPAQWKETVERWTGVIDLMTDFDEASCWDLGMIFLSKHHAALQSGEINSKWLAQGTRRLEQHGRFWMRGMTTYWHDFLLPKLPRVGVIERLLDIPKAG